MSEDSLTWGGPVPLYQQLADIIRHQIATGQIPAGSPIPSKATLAQRYEVGEKTVDHAVRLLKAEGLIKPTQGLGLFVVRQP